MRSLSLPALKSFHQIVKYHSRSIGQQHQKSKLTAPQQHTPKPCFSAQEARTMIPIPIFVFAQPQCEGPVNSLINT